MQSLWTPLMTIILSVKTIRWRHNEIGHLAMIHEMIWVHKMSMCTMKWMNEKQNNNNNELLNGTNDTMRDEWDDCKWKKEQYKGWMENEKCLQMWPWIEWSISMEWNQKWMNGKMSVSWWSVMTNEMNGTTVNEKKRMKHAWMVSLITSITYILQSITY